MKTSIKKSVWVVVTLLLILIFQQICSKIGAFVADFIDYSAIDKYDVFAWISIHHIVQALIALVVIAIMAKFYNIDFGLKLGDKRLGIKYVLIFTASMLAYIAIISVGIYLGNRTMQYSYPLTYINVLGSLGFQLFLSGTSEEILFRALPISIIVCLIPYEKGVKIFKLHISWAIIITAIFFALAHIKWTVVPFTISYDFMQLLFSFALGIVYGKVYQKTNSVLYPMIMHSLTNVAVVGSGYILSIIK